MPGLAQGAVASAMPPLTTSRPSRPGWMTPLRSTTAILRTPADCSIFMIATPGCAGTGDDDLEVVELAVGHPCGVDQRRQRHDGRAVLVVVEHRDLEALDQPALDLEAPRARDVLEVDAAERRGEADDRLDDLVDVGRVERDRDRVDAAELLEQHGLALHHGHRGGRADVAEAEHRGAVRDDRDGVGDPGVVVGQRRVGRDRLAHPGDAGRVGHREVLRIAQRDRRGDRHLAAAVQREDRVVGVWRVCVHVDVSRNHDGNPSGTFRTFSSGPIRSPARQVCRSLLPAEAGSHGLCPAVSLSYRAVSTRAPGSPAAPAGRPA